MKQIPYIALTIFGGLLEYAALSILTEPQPPHPITEQVSVPAPVPTIAPAPVSHEGSPTVAEQEAGKGTVDSLEDSNPSTSNREALNDLPSKGSNFNDFEVRMLAENNRIRMVASKPPQILDPRLCQAAQEQATWLGQHGYRVSVVSGHYFGNGDWVSRSAKYGFYGDVGENLGVGYSGATHAFHCWSVESPGHYATLIGNYDRCGFGESRNQWGQLIYVCVYGREIEKAASFPAAPNGSGVLVPQSHGVVSYERNVAGVLHAAILPQSCPTGQCFRPLQHAQHPRQYVPQTRRGVFGWRNR